MNKLGLTILLCLQLLTADDTAAQDIERLYIVQQMEGAKSLTDDQRIESVGSLLTWNGYRTDEGGGSGFRGSLAPKLYSDANVNGGYLGTGFTLNGLQFTVDPDFRAEQDTVVGLELNSEAFLRVGLGRTLRLSGDLSFGRASNHTLQDSSASLCSLNEVAKRTYLDACYEQRTSDRSLGSASSSTRSLALSRIFLSSGAATSLALRVSNDMSGTRSVSSMQVTARTLTDRGMLGEFYVASDIDNLPLNGYQTLGLSLQSKVFGATTKISLEATRSKDGLFFGTPRSAEAVKFTLSRKLMNRLTVEIGYQKTDASVDLFASESLTFSLAMTPLRF